MEARRDVFSLKTVCLITGASKGLGQCMAIRFAELFPEGSCLILVARSEKGLEKTSLQIRGKCPKIQVKSKVMDLATASETDFENLLSEIFTGSAINRSDFEQSLIVHNAGSLGDVTAPLSSTTSAETVQQYLRLNVTSAAVLNAVWHQFFRQQPAPTQRTVVAISSLCALQPFKCWGLYCAGKAARDMLFSAYAAEEPDCLVLSYAPGPLDTGMQEEARTLTADTELRQMFADMKASGKLLSPDDSVTKLIKLLRQNSFDSGAHIDYYDVE